MLYDNFEKKLSHILELRDCKLVPRLNFIFSTYTSLFVVKTSLSRDSTAIHRSGSTPCEVTHKVSARITGSSFE